MHALLVWALLSGTVTTGTFHSGALGVDKQYVVWLPQGYATSTARYPVIYMLHGLGGSELDWTRGAHIEQAADQIGLHAILVMPDGDDSFYANSVTPADYEKCLLGKRLFGFGKTDMKTYCVKQARYEDYIVKDLVAHIDATYRTIPRREARAIGGLSMGGFGALELAMRHKDLFSSVASHSGVDSLFYVGPHPYAKDKVVLGNDVSQWGKTVEPIGGLVRSIFGPDIANWRAHDPATLAAKLKNGELAIYIDCGTEDGFGLNDAASHLHDVLAKAGVAHKFVLAPGGHHFSFWRQHVGDSLRFHAEQFKRAGVLPN